MKLTINNVSKIGGVLRGIHWVKKKTANVMGK
jgi:hypothetical protein